MNNRQLFLKHLGQTSPEPLCIEIVKAEGAKMWDADGNEYIDLIGGISVCNVGHRNPKVINAIKKQLDNYLHVMVNGELILSPQTEFAKLLTDHLPASLDTVFFTASGTEATEGAMKLAKRATGRSQVIAFKNSYHGSTQGSLSIMGDEYWRNAFRPLLPDILHLDFNTDDLESITDRTACVVAETIQAEAGVIVPSKKWLQQLRKKCTESGTLLVLDEIQCGFGRNGTLWAFEQFDIVPDILLLGKALGGGMPLGAFIAGKNLMDTLSFDPVLGHINTFGGHPVCCAAGTAAMKFLLDEKLIKLVEEKRKLFIKHLHHPKIKAVRSCGLMIAVEFADAKQNSELIRKLLKPSAGCPAVFTDWFLFAPQCLRIVPPLTISDNEILQACKIFLQRLNE